MSEGEGTPNVTQGMQDFLDQNKINLDGLQGDRFQEKTRSQQKEIA